MKFVIYVYKKEFGVVGGCIDFFRCDFLKEFFFDSSERDGISRHEKLEFVFIVSSLRGKKQKFEGEKKCGGFQTKTV